MARAIPIRVGLVQSQNVVPFSSGIPTDLLPVGLAKWKAPKDNLATFMYPFVLWKATKELSANLLLAIRLFLLSFPFHLTIKNLDHVDILQRITKFFSGCFLN